MKPYILFLILALSILLFERPDIVESSNFAEPTNFVANRLEGGPFGLNTAEQKKTAKKRGGILSRLFGFFGRGNSKNNERELEPLRVMGSTKTENSAHPDDSEVEDSEASKGSDIIFNKHGDFSASFSGGSLEPQQSIGEFSQEKIPVSEESKSAPVPIYEQSVDESKSTPESEQMKDEFISLYDEDYNEAINRGVRPRIDIPEEFEKSSISVIGEDQKPGVSEQSEAREESIKEDISRSSDSQIPGEASLQESLPKSASPIEESRSGIAEDIENEESEKQKLDSVSGKENHYDASYESNLEEMEKSISEYRAKFSENFSDELPHETYDRLLNDALKHDSQPSISLNKEKSLNEAKYSTSEQIETSKTSPKEESLAIEKYLEDTADVSKAESEVSTADLDKETINLNEGMSKYPSQNGATEEEPEDLEDFLVRTDIKVPEASETSIKSDIKSASIPSEYIRERTRTATEPPKMQEQDSGSEKELEQESEGEIEQESEKEPEQELDRESEQEFDEKSEEASNRTEESSRPSEKSIGIISRVSNTFKNFISSFGNSNKEPSMTNKEESVPVPVEETQKTEVESSVKEESEKPAELPEANKSKVKMLIEHFEKENVRNMPAPIGIPRNKLGLRNTGGSSENKNIDNLINFFENEDIKAKEEAKKYQEGIKKREVSRTEGSVGQLQQTSEEDLGEIQLESMNIEESPESGEEREAEIMREINGEPSSETSGVELESSNFSQTSNYEESQEELSVPIAIPNIYEQDKLAGGLIWALGIGKYVCNSKNTFSKSISPPLSNNVLVSAPSQEQMAKLLQLSGGEVSGMIMDLVLSVLAQN
ncbi:signal peptide containing [Cryptosporidium sp. chipmunk genotype I]|uniref:signal peptide containing n=1 Tax=Cryptosporidium sp. chipmunk genotype I TaxID=1280935 RepID=UPI00351AAB5D|nr:signal peptide containing [Cryptosporidium sp. chipmunk genotype I]